ncbi:FAD/NAD(P)-binding domain-containing protein [Phaeosphaeriaceae sp. SRC1lsM3a]|nr:FAD/NAD(P)-binding domain-containing protein [Stagonospora sp. SRC1lsM3a]
MSDDINSDTKAPHVLIIGAGTSGLLLAQGLRKHRIHFTIFESSTLTTYTTRPREWGMTLHWGASHISSCLPAELAARFHEAYADPNLPDGKVTGLPVYNGKTGELIMEMGADKPVRVSRRKMRGLCGEGVEVQYGKKFVSAKVGGNGKVTVEFEDGEQVEGDVLIGCDGARSRVRSVLVGEEGAKLADAGVGMFNFPYKFDAELAGRIRGMNELFVTSIHPDHGNMFWLSIQDVPRSSPSDPSTWTFQVLLSFPLSSIPGDIDLTTQEGRMSFFKSRGATYAEPWHSACAQISDSTYLPLDQTTYWANAAAWPNHNGRMTLCGDAAHPMTPHRGQGLNNAVLDSAKFVAAMVRVRDGEIELKDTVDAYDAEVLERGKAEMEVSLKQTLLIHDWETLMESPMVKMGMRQGAKK